MIKPALIFTLALATATTACSRLQKDDGVRFDGQKFRIKANKVSRDDRSRFVVTSAPVSASMEGAREAAAYGGTRYCIEEYGTSLIAWAHGPEAEPRIDGDRLVLEGQCRP